jgi:hypothetical protein
MNECDRVRGVGQLCFHCTRNIAYYRAGWMGKNFVSNDDFWVNANSNFLDIAVLEWCKLFTDTKGKHYWTKVVPKSETFMSSLYADIGITEGDFDACYKEMQTYRDKFVAHLDAERRMQIPKLTIAFDTVVFLYSVVRTAYPDYLHDAPLDLKAFYNERFAHGRIRYPTIST